MIRWYLFGTLAVAALLLAYRTQIDAGGKKSDSKVKATAVASKISADGKQTITITLTIDKGWYLYANPLNTNNEFIEGSQTVVKVSGKGKLTGISIAYPPGKKHVDGKDHYDIYEGTVRIPVVLNRAGNESPVQIRVNVNACSGKECLLQGTIELTTK